MNTKIVWTECLVERLGKQTDVSISREYGIPNTWVWAERTRRGIPAYKPQKNTAASPISLPTPASQKKWTESDVALLGKITDREVALKTGRTREAVATYRREHGILGVDHMGKPRQTKPVIGILEAVKAPADANRWIPLSQYALKCLRDIGPGTSLWAVIRGHNTPVPCAHFSQPFPPQDIFVLASGSVVLEEEVMYIAPLTVPKMPVSCL